MRMHRAIGLRNPELISCAEKIPGLGPLLEKITDSISGTVVSLTKECLAELWTALVFVFTTLEPFLKPIMSTATTGLGSLSAEVVDNVDQYEVEFI